MELTFKESMTPKFSVLLSLYYKEKPQYLDKSLASVFNQTLKADEVILVEDGPLTQDLYEVVNKYHNQYSELKVVLLDKNVGLGKALNEGLKHCTYDIVARMDTDDIAFPTRFEKQIKVMEQHPEYDVVSSWVNDFEDNVDNIVGVNVYPEHSEEIKEYAKWRCPVAHSATMFRKSTVLANGGYLTQYFPEDYFLWVRMLKNGSKFYNIQESLVHFRTSLETMRKRGGWKYALDEYHVERMMYQMEFITFTEFLRNCIFRCGMRIIPNTLREYIYKKKKYNNKKK